MVALKSLRMYVTMQSNKAHVLSEKYGKTNKASFDTWIKVVGIWAEIRNDIDGLLSDIDLKMEED